MNMSPPPESKLPNPIPEVEREIRSTEVQLKVTGLAGIRKEEITAFVKNGVLTIDIDQKQPTTGPGSSSESGVQVQLLKLLVKHNFGPIKWYKLEGIKAELSDGVLKVVVPNRDNREEEEDEDEVLHVEVN